MTMNKTSTSYGAASIAEQIKFGIAAGSQVRAQAAKSGHSDLVAMEAANTDEMSILRSHSVIAQVPLLVARAVGVSMSWDREVKVPVMVLNTQEYPGPARRTPFGPTAEELDTNKLQLAGKVVFDFLNGLGLLPALAYVYDGMTRTYTLQIVITVAVQ